ncbi:MAG: hypothetical protein IPM77_05540 [Crocinitomicaceae bacterium]|nr:hypothetical protein [Crocinitomicaceae bacterium]
MKFFLQLFIASFITVSYAYGEYIPYNYYQVKKDVFNSDVAAGTAVMKGKILDVNENPVAGGLVSNFDRSRFCYSDAKGNYSMVLSILDTSVFFYHQNYGEIVIWKYDFQSQHMVEINFITMEHTEVPVTVEKPVIYFYSGKELTASVSVNHPDLIFTYPVSDGNWNVAVQPDGNIQNRTDGKVYPYIFWEGESENISYVKKNNQVEGNLIESKNVIAYLENSLAALGLNQKEQTDFITYWGPRMILSDYVFVQFILDENVTEAVCDLSVTPKPESFRRVYMLFTPLESPALPFEFNQQNFSSFDRTGFTVLEWGGSELPFRKIISEI